MYLSIQRHYGDDPEEMADAFKRLASRFKETPDQLSYAGVAAMLEIATLSFEQDVQLQANMAAPWVLTRCQQKAQSVAEDNLRWAASPHIHPHDRGESLRVANLALTHGIRVDHRLARAAIEATEIEPSVSSLSVWSGPQFKPSPSGDLVDEPAIRAFYMAYVDVVPTLVGADQDLKPHALRGLSVAGAVCCNVASNVAAARVRVLQA